MIKKDLVKALSEQNKVIVLFGPRQAGKTTLVKKIMEEINDSPAYLTGDDLFVQELFGKNDLEALKRAVGTSRLLIIDEAQRIPGIGLSLKLLVDNLPLTVVATGSSSFDLANKVHEPLTGRTTTFQLFPLSWMETAARFKQTSSEETWERLLRFGMYPRVHALEGEAEKRDYLHELVNAYLYKDILAFAGIRKPKKVIDLLTLLAFQIGNQVSLAELARQLSISRLAVERYLDVLEKMFVLINVRGFSRNLRKETSKMSKYYFVDVGLRNALIRNFNPLPLRQDVGVLFENWFVMEKIKAAAYRRNFANFYFWRTHDGQELDLIEENAGQLTAYECKWSEGKAAKPPHDWRTAYPEATFKEANRVNCFSLLES
jgi:hypothetical protein